MRTFDDPAGRPWQAALLEASYGNIRLVFSPLEGEGVRQCALSADNLADAERQLAAFGAAQLCAQLAGSRPWDPAAALPS